MISVLLKSVASGSSMTSCATLVAHAGRTRRRPGRRDSGGALPVRWSVRYLDRPRMPAAGLRRPPSRSARTTWPLWGSSLRAPSVAGDLPPPHRRTGFPQPVATLLPPNHARQAYDPVARSLGRSAAPPQQRQPSLRAAASSSVEHGKSGARFSCTDLGTLCRHGSIKFTFCIPKGEYDRSTWIYLSCTH